MSRYGKFWQLAVVLVFLIVVGANAQNNGIESGRFSLSARIIGPHTLQKPFEVRLLHESERVIARVTVSSGTAFKFNGLTGGAYYLAADVPGFQKLRQRIDVNGVPDVVAAIFLEPEPQTVVEKPLDLWGEETDVIDVADMAQYPDKLLDQFRLANEELQGKNFERARKLLEPVVREARDFYEAHKALGLSYQKLQRYRDAEVEYRTARDLRPDSAAPLTSLGSLYVQEADIAPDPVATRRILNDALENLLQAIQLNPGFAFAHYLLGVTYYKAGLYEDAESSLLHSFEMEPRLSDARLALANVYIRMQEWPNAFEQLKAYVSENPDGPGLDQARQTESRIEEILNAEDGQTTARDQNRRAAQ